LWNGKSSPTNWTNIVTSCGPCNRKKGSKTLSQANMYLKNLPCEPNKNTKYLTIAQELSTIKDTIPEEWKTFLPESYYNF
jgi:hypothetical protein